jgi:hypothetical protein
MGREWGGDHFLALRPATRIAPTPVPIFFPSSFMRSLKLSPHPRMTNKYNMKYLYTQCKIYFGELLGDMIPVWWGYNPCAHLQTTFGCLSPPFLFPRERILCGRSPNETVPTGISIYRCTLTSLFCPVNLLSLHNLKECV